MMRRFMTIAFGAAWMVLAPLAATARNPTYGPTWNVGDTWTVRVTVQLMRKTATRAAATISQDVDYHYRVVGLGTVNGRGVVKISVTPAAAGWSAWLLTFDAVDITLDGIEQIVAPGTTVTLPNPFGFDAWMAKLGEFSGTIIHDFPKAPDQNINETRQLTAPQASTPGFTQAVEFLANTMQVTMTRTDPVARQMQRTTILWAPGKPWWSSATTTLGKRTIVSARLL